MVAVVVEGPAILGVIPEPGASSLDLDRQPLARDQGVVGNDFGLSVDAVVGQGFTPKNQPKSPAMMSRTARTACSSVR